MKPILAALAILLFVPAAASANPEYWAYEWPRTAFESHSVPLEEIFDVIPKDRIRSIDEPEFAPATSKAEVLAPREPVLSVRIEGKAKAYPLRIMTRHEIVNDELGGKPIAVTYCPLCNSGIVFERELDGELLDFGTTGKLRNSDLVMYDRQSESWWQQFMGEAIVGSRTGTRLTMLPSRLESWERFLERNPEGEVLVPPADLPYEAYYNPYRGYDSYAVPMFAVEGLERLPAEVAPLDRVIAVEDEAWTLALLREQKKIERGDLRLIWEPGQASALDTASIPDGQEVGNVIVERKDESGAWRDALHDVTFAFVFNAFKPDGELHH